MSKEIIDSDNKPVSLMSTAGVVAFESAVIAGDSVLATLRAGWSVFNPSNLLMATTGGVMIKAGMFILPLPYCQIPGGVLIAVGSLEELIVAVRAVRGASNVIDSTHKANVGRAAAINEAVIAYRRPAPVELSDLEGPILTLIDDDSLPITKKQLEDLKRELGEYQVAQLSEENLKNEIKAMEERRDSERVGTLMQIAMNTPFLTTAAAAAAVGSIEADALRTSRIHRSQSWSDVVSDGRSEDSGLKLKQS